MARYPAGHKGATRRKILEASEPRQSGRESKISVALKEGISQEQAKKIGKQLQYADKRGFRLALIAGEDELAAGNVQVKDLKTGESRTLPLAGDDLVAALRTALAS